MREADPLRVSDLSRSTGLSRPTVDAVADDLVRLGWVAELAGAGAGPSAGGRRGGSPSGPTPGTSLGIDIGEHRCGSRWPTCAATSSRSACSARGGDARARLENIRRLHRPR